MVLVDFCACVAAPAESPRGGEGTSLWKTVAVALLYLNKSQDRLSSHFPGAKCPISCCQDEEPPFMQSKGTVGTHSDLPLRTKALS